jgi:3-oxoacyl-[acyl-carrier protein] reductase
MHIEFTNKAVIVTGAAHGFGRAIALAFAERGANVWACDVIASELTETQALCQTAGGRCTVRTVDVTNPEQVTAFTTEAIASAASGHIDVLVNNAGGVLGQVGQPLEQVTYEQWNAIIAVNMSAAFYFAQAAAPGMKQARSGRIINISSMGARAAFPSMAAYAPAKAGIEALTRLLAVQLGPRGITVNAVSPGLTDTAMNRVKLGTPAADQVIATIALGRIGQPADIADVVGFVASDDARWVTGQCIEVSGGQSL